MNSTKLDRIRRTTLNLAGEDALYKYAMKRISELVEEVFQICDEVADENH